MYYLATNPNWRSRPDFLLHGRNILGPWEKMGGIVIHSGFVHGRLVSCVYDLAIVRTRRKEIYRILYHHPYSLFYCYRLRDVHCCVHYVMHSGTRCTATANSKRCLKAIPICVQMYIATFSCVSLPWTSLHLAKMNALAATP